MTSPADRPLTWLQRGLLVLAVSATIVHGAVLAGPAEWRRRGGMFAALAVSVVLSFGCLLGSFLLWRRSGRRVALAARVFSNIWMILALLLAFLVATGR